LANLAFEYRSLDNTNGCHNPDGNPNGYPTADSSCYGEIAIFVLALALGQWELDARTLTFTTLILANLGLILSEGSTSRLNLKILRSPNLALW
jgi:hypothetical protein